MHTEHFKDRLARAIKRKGCKKTAFAAEMTHRGVRGGHYRSLMNYLAGSSKPSPKWIEEAAEFLEVSPEWLRIGEGHMQRVNAALDMEDAPLTWEEVFHASLPPVLAKAIEHNAPTAKRSFLTAWQALVTSARRKQDHALTRGELLAIGKRTAAPVLFTLDYIGAGNRDDWTPTEFAVCLGQMWDAIALAAPKAGTGLTLANLTEDSDA